MELLIKQVIINLKVIWGFFKIWISVKFHNYGYITRGGSLERNKTANIDDHKPSDAYSDTDAVNNQRQKKLQMVVWVT